MIFWRSKALYLYSTVDNICGSQGKSRESPDCLEDDSEAFGEIPVPKGTFGKDFRSFREAYRVSLSRVKEAWTLSSSYGNQVQTQQSHLSQGFGGSALNLEVSISLCDIPK